MTTPKNPCAALAPCPFCGGHAYYNHTDAGPERKYYRVHCEKCDARIGHPYTRKDAARQAWNTRAALTPKPSGGDVELQDVIDWADGVAGALGTEYASRVTDTEAAVAMGVKAALTPSPDYVMVPREPTREMIKSAWTAQYLNIGADMAMAENLAEIRVNDTKQKSQDQLAYEAMIAPYVGEKK